MRIHSSSTPSITALTDPLAARGDLITHDGSTYVRAPIDAVPGKVWTTDGTDASWTAPAGGLTDITESTDSATYVALSVTLANGDFVAAPNGQGGFALTVHDGSATGGNALGGNAVDLLGSRSDATKVASGYRSSLLGGFNNVASASYSTVVGGVNCSALGQYTGVLAGSACYAYGSYAAGIGGLTCDASGTHSAYIGGQSASCAGSYSAAIAGKYLLAQGNCTVAFGNTARPEQTCSTALSGNSIGGSAQRGKSQKIDFHLDARANGSTPTIMKADTAGYLICPYDGMLSIVGRCSVYNETADTITDFDVDICCKRVANVLTFTRNSITLLAGSDDAGTPTLVATTSSSGPVFTFTPTADMMRASLSGWASSSQS